MIDKETIIKLNNYALVEKEVNKHKKHFIRFLATNHIKQTDLYEQKLYMFYDTLSIFDKDIELLIASFRTWAETYPVDGE